MPLYIATVRIVIEADNQPEACDAVSAALTENLMQSRAILNWAYPRQPSGGHASPKRVTVPIDPDWIGTMEADLEELDRIAVEEAL